MKKLCIVFLCFVLMFSLSGCGLLSGPSSGEGDPPGDTGEPTLYLNPLTGVTDRETPYTGRPFAVSVNNIDVSLPQSGISSADIVVEIETEGGITRLMCLFTEPELAEGGIGSIRSLRHPFVYAVWQWNPVIVHIGASDYTQDYLTARGIRTMNGFYSESFLYVDQQRRKNYDTEHTKYTDAARLSSAMSDSAFNLSSSWSPASSTAFHFSAEDNPTVPAGGGAARFRFDYSKSYDAEFVYDASSGTYSKYQHGNAVVDAGANNAALRFENVLVLFAPINALYGDLVDVDYSNGGSGYYFNGGQYEQITWRKDAADANFVFTRADGSELFISPGKTHLSIVSTSRAGSMTIEAAEDTP